MIAGMMRIKNEARWIRAVLDSALEVCDHIFIMDDHSTDDTAAICRDFPHGMVTFYSSPFEGLDEARDKNWLLTQLQSQCRADWVLSIDGDELLTEHECIAAAIAQRHTAQCYALQVLYLWDRDDQVRTDGVYGRFWRPSLFRLAPGAQTFRATRNGGNFHCGNVPREIVNSGHCGARLMHFGYMHAEDRRRKFDWYNLKDPNNLVEDQYRHMIQGDAGGPPPHMKLRHAGPLKLEATNALL